MCKLTYDLVQKSTLLQYAIELGVAGLVDGDGLERFEDSDNELSLTTAERLERLRRQERAWWKVAFKRTWVSIQRLSS